MEVKQNKTVSVEINDPIHGKIVFNPIQSEEYLNFKSVEHTFELALVTIQFEKEGILWKISGNPKKV